MILEAVLYIHNGYIMESKNMPSRGYKKPDARRHSLSVRLDDRAMRILDSRWAPGLPLRGNRAEALAVFLQRWQGLEDHLWRKVRPTLSVEDLRWILKGIAECSLMDPWRSLCDAIWDPDFGTENVEAAATARKVAGWDVATRLAVAMRVEAAMISASRQNSEWAEMGAISTERIEAQLRTILEVL